MGQLRAIAKQWVDSIFNYFDEDILQNRDDHIVPWEDYVPQNSAQ
jgi:hypothetical protein